MTDYTTVNARDRRIRLVVLDGELVKHFYTRDGLGIKMLQSTGIPVAILTGRLSAQTAARAAELGITLVKQGKQFKTDAFRELIAEVGVTPEETAYMGDDVPDIPVLKTAGLAAVPADASDEVKPLAHWQSPKTGGNGAVRSLAELILKAQAKWDDLIFRHYVRDEALR